MGEKHKLEWESIDAPPGDAVQLFRAAVPGGWLVGVAEAFDDGGMGGLTFVPDPQHTWKGGSVDRG